MSKDSQTHAILGAAMEVHRRLGHGFLDAVYQAALAIEFAEREIVFCAEAVLPLHYKGKLLTCATEQISSASNQFWLRQKQSLS